MEVIMSLLPTPKTVIYDRIINIDLHADYYAAKEPRKNKTIIYFHGGGLVYGSRTDLPSQYLELFLNSGYDFFTVDYPLYPETDVDDILKYCCSALDWFINNGETMLGLSSTDYILFGRSAGGYIANYLTAHFVNQRPLKLISLYSYFDLIDEKLMNPNSHYLKYPIVTQNMIQNIIQKNPISTGKLEKRYLFYVYLRQKGIWISPDKDVRTRLSISEETISKFPPTFLTASSTDTDVPYEQSLRMHKLIENSLFYTVNNEQHDYDKDYKNPAAIELYNKIIDWL
jgi:acetyl esterase